MEVDRRWFSNIVYCLPLGPKDMIQIWLLFKWVETTYPNHPHFLTGILGGTYGSKIQEMLNEAMDRLAGAGRFEQKVVSSWALKEEGGWVVPMPPPAGGIRDCKPLAYIYIYVCVCKYRDVAFICIYVQIHISLNTADY